MSNRHKLYMAITAPDSAPQSHRLVTAPAVVVALDIRSAGEYASADQ